ncbi:YncE family protein [Vineibacter terrae]|uniref:YncE family protein n=1 Tax=Vineibacter terrae TaxID=2586908 RepID=UPI002E36F806|nr:YncE family protein [Vineibacter terrae]HEX2886810.1 YncE family protein [Vineibacter terrae]
MMLRLPMAAVLAGMLLVGAASWRMAAAEPDRPLVLERTIRLRDIGGRIGHIAVDVARKRLFVAELGNDTVAVVDLERGRVTHRIDGMRAPQGIAYTPRADVLAITNGGDGSVRLFHGADLTSMATVALENNADAIRVDPGSGRLIVGYGRGGLAVIDPSKGTLVSTIKLPAHPEGFQIDPGTGRLFANLPDRREIAIVDLAAGKQVGSWPVKAQANFAMAIDPAGSRLIITSRRPARFVVLDAKTGASLVSQQTCRDSDDVSFDAKRQLAYVSCGDGRLDVFAMSNGYPRLTQLTTRADARTSLFVPELDRLFVGARAALLGTNAAVLVFRPGS